MGVQVKPNRKHEARRLDLLTELDLLGGHSFPELDRLTRLAADICGAEAALLSVFDTTHENQISVSSGEKTRKPREVTFCNHTLGTRSHLVISDARMDARVHDNPYVTGDPYVCSYAGVCVGADGEPIGALCVIDRRPKQFGDAELMRLQQVAALVDTFLQSRLEAQRERRRAEQTDEVRRRQHQFEKIFEALQEGANIYSPDGAVIDANPASPAILGVTRDQLLNRAPADPSWRTFRADGTPFPGDDYPVMRALRGVKSRDTRMGVSLPSGEVRWLNVNATPVADKETGKLDFAVVTFADITAQHQAELELNSKAEKLAVALKAAEQGSQAKTDFLAVMSHELRTPMNAVLGCAQLLAKGELDPVQTRTLAVLEDAGRQMLVLLNDLLDLVSLDADKVRLAPEPLNLVTLIEDAAVIWAADIRAKGLTLSVMIDPALRAARNVDRARLLQILGNLIGNAIKFTAQGSVTIQAAPVGKGDTVAIDVIDTGPGVPPEAAEHIFSVFEQVDVSSTRRHGGLGIGLHVARRLAQAMGGDILLDSRLGEGARFTVRFKAPKVSGADIEDDDTSASASVRDILCIDDNPRNLYVLGEILRAAGHTVRECTSGSEALDIAARNRFDVILLDMVMPEMDGLEVLAQLRASGGANAETPVIACTANVLPDQMTTYRESGVASVIAKPLDVAQVLTAVAAVAA